jgi:NAD-dependent SIR2 family protein deacetylase
MADTALKTEEEKKEFFDTPEELDAKVSQLAAWIQESSHFTAFTGAGISTSAGIPDYRSGFNTVLPTGPGCWEKKAQGKASNKPKIRTEMSKAIPTPTHMALVRLMEEGLLKYLISQNVDGLHRRSGIDPGKLAEVHGNTNLEKCLKCKKEYMRDFRVRTAQKVHDHETGRLCEDDKCRGKLIDSIINFGENLDEVILENGFAHSEQADLCLAMGSSLTVTPAANMPKTTSKRGGKLVIVNLQKTPLDKFAALKIHAFCDTVIQMLMEKLHLDIPPFKLNRRLRVTKKTESKNGSQQDFLEFLGIDVDGCPYSLFTSVVVSKGNVKKELKKSPLKYQENLISGQYKVTLNFQGHYGEPPVNFDLNTNDLQMAVYHMVFDPLRKRWESVTRL